MDIQEAKRQRRLRRIYNRILHDKRLRMPKFRVHSEPVSWWRRMLEHVKSFFKWLTRKSKTQM